MHRVLVLGPCGAGKSTLAFALAERWGLPLFHMDKLAWMAGWIERSDAELAERIAVVVGGDEWLLEGNYGSTLHLRLPLATQVIYLDYPIPLCMWRILKRIRRYRGTTRPDMTEGCEERFDPGFMLYVAGWPWGPRKRLEDALAGYEDRIVRLRSPRETERWLEALPTR